MKPIDRKSFIKAMSGITAISTLSAFNRFTSGLEEQDQIMPVLFMGHGSPINGIEQNEFTEYWKKLAADIPVPKAVLVISAHWLSKGTRITAMEFPKTIHDFGGFPDELYKVNYPAPGDPQLARETASLVSKTGIEMDHDWGLDHGTWTIVRHMYPQADIPVLQLSMDYTREARFHYELARELMPLRKKGVLFIGSGNMVHNLRMVAWDKLGEKEFGFDWALQMNSRFKELIANGNHDQLVNYRMLGEEARLSIPTPEHYLPLLYSLGLKAEKDTVGFFNDRAVGGSLTMTSVRLG